MFYKASTQHPDALWRSGLGCLYCGHRRYGWVFSKLWHRPGQCHFPRANCTI